MEKILNKLNLNTKKGVENLVIILVLVVIVMIVVNSIFSKEESYETNNSVVVSTNVTEKTFEEKLKGILESIGGVSNVNVLISYENSVEKVPLYDTKEVTTITEEKDKNGGERKTKEVNNEYSIAYDENGSSKTALVKQNIMPKMIGVVVTANGGDNSALKEQIINAVMALTGLPSNKIQVFGK